MKIKWAFLRSTARPVKFGAQESVRFRSVIYGVPHFRARERAVCLPNWKALLQLKISHFLRKNGARKSLLWRYIVSFDDGRVKWRIIRTFRANSYKFRSVSSPECLSLVEVVRFCFFFVGEIYAIVAWFWENIVFIRPTRVVNKMNLEWGSSFPG